MTLLLAGLSLSSAWAGSVSLDTTLVRPSVGQDDVVGVAAPFAPGRNALSVGVDHTLEVDPVVIWADGQELGSAVALRNGLWLGGAWAPARRVLLRADLPIFQQLGDGTTHLDANGVGLGDLRAGVRVTPLALGPAALALSGDLYLPTSTPDAWMGERGLRFEGGMELGAHFGPLTVLGNGSYMARGEVDTGLVPNVADTVQGSGGLSLAVWPGRAAFDVSWVGRSSVSAIAAGAVPASEVMVGMRAWIGAHLRVNATVGKGLAPGVGSCEFNSVLGVSWVRRPAPPAPPPAPIASTDDDALPEVTVAEAPPPPPPVVVVTQNPLAWVARATIEIRDPIRFAYGTARILPESQPTLSAVAEILESHPEIDQIVIEGHASEEGSFAYNYDLSLRRATAVFEDLVKGGVHPERLSVRSMGEVEPADPGQSESDKAINRRVEFHIVHRVGPGETPPTYTVGVRQPWDGQPAPVVPPKGSP